MGLYIRRWHTTQTRSPQLWVARRRAVRMCRFQPIEHVRLLEHPGVPRVRQRRAHVLRVRDGLQRRPFPAEGTLPKRPRKDPDDEPTVEYTPRLSSARRRAKRVGKVSELPAVGAIGEDAALLYDAVATAELDAARTPPSTDNEDDALALMALSRS